RDLNKCRKSLALGGCLASLGRVGFTKFSFAHSSTLTIATDQTVVALLLYLRLIGYTIGTLLQLFWMVVILGYRRRRNFERVFFLLCLALFLFYSGSLLALNAQIHYAIPPVGVQVFAATLLLAGLCLVPPTLVHLHLEY